jgi:two-component system, cell cycle sensor histidine kinase and response regulator CckA
VTETASAALLELLSDGVAWLDAQGGIVRANAAMTRLLGYTREADIVGLGLLHDLNVGPVPTGEILERLHHTGEIRHVEIELMRRDGSRAVVLFSGRSLLPADRWPIAFEVVCSDVTDRTRLETRWRRHERIVTAGTAAGGLGVDVERLLAAILGYHDLIAERTEDPHAKTDLAELREAAETLMMLMRQLVAFIRPRVLHPVRTEANAVIQHLMADLQDATSEAEVRLSCIGGRGEIVVEPSEFADVLLTLATAVADASPGAPVTVLVDTPYLDATFSREQMCLPPGHYVSVTMSTAGGSDEALAAPDWERERFFTPDMLDTDDPLPLARAYAFAKHNGGHLTIRRGDRPGITFRIYLPRVMSAARRRTILLVEDEPRVRCSARRVLEHLGYTVVEAPDGQEALWLASRHPGPIHLLLTDVVLPGVSAQELADRLAQSRPATRVLFMSGLPKDTLVARNAVREDCAFVDKPFSIEEIASRLAELLPPDLAESESGVRRE